MATAVPMTAAIDPMMIAMVITTPRSRRRAHQPFSEGLVAGAGHGGVPASMHGLPAGRAAARAGDGRRPGGVDVDAAVSGAQGGAVDGGPVPVDDELDGQAGQLRRLRLALGRHDAAFAGRAPALGRSHDLSRYW